MEEEVPEGNRFHLWDSRLLFGSPWSTKTRSRRLTRSLDLGRRKSSVDWFTP